MIFEVTLQVKKMLIGSTLERMSYHRSGCSYTADAMLGLLKFTAVKFPYQLLPGHECEAFPCAPP